MRPLFPNENYYNSALQAGYGPSPASLLPLMGVADAGQWVMGSPNPQNTGLDGFFNSGLNQGPSMPPIPQPSLDISALVMMMLQSRMAREERQADFQDKLFQAQSANMQQMFQAMLMMSYFRQSDGDSGISSASVAGGSRNNDNPSREGNVGMMLAKAQSMVGKTETGDTAEIQKLTKINPATTAWCSAFAINLLENYGLLDTSGLSNRNKVSVVMDWAKEKGIWARKGSYRPKPGDAIIFGGGSHIGLVKSVDSDGTIHTIEGNKSNAVKEKSYPPNSSYVTGFVVTGRNQQTQEV